MKLGEDFFYVRAAAKKGKFGFIPSLQLTNFTKTRFSSFCEIERSSHSYKAKLLPLYMVKRVNSVGFDEGLISA